MLVELANRLTSTNYDFIAGRAVSAPSLLTQLQGAIGASTGSAGGGGSSLANERSALNVGAFVLYQDITGRIATLYQQVTGLPPTPDPARNLMAWLDDFTLADTRGEISDRQLRTARQRLANFVEQITSLLDPPKVIEIIGSCPNCEERYWPIDREGTRIAALYVAVSPGRELRALCHWCGEAWTGADELEDLNFSLSAEPWEKKIRAKLAHWRTLCATFSSTA